MAGMVEPIKIRGLVEFNKSLKSMSDDAPKQLRLANNEAADIVVMWATSHVVRRSGAAARTIKAKSTRTLVRVSGGSKARPYYPWLDFGGKVGRKHSVKRPYLKSGRYIYPGYTNNVQRVEGVLVTALVKVATDAGLEVTGE